jgi:NAD(P)H-dependent FMN reductase
MPFFNEPKSPAYMSEPFKDPAVVRWTEKIGAQDGFIVVAPEYNRSLGGEMKNAFDWVYREWTHKAVGFVGYGSVGGARAVEHMRLIAVELEMAPAKHAVHLPISVYMSMMELDAPVDPALFAPVEPAAEKMLGDLIWWTSALKAARDKGVIAEAA